MIVGGGGGGGGGGGSGADSSLCPRDAAERGNGSATRLRVSNKLTSLNSTVTPNNWAEFYRSKHKHQQLTGVKKFG